MWTFRLNAPPSIEVNAWTEKRQRWCGSAWSTNVCRWLGHLPRAHASVQMLLVSSQILHPILGPDSYFPQASLVILRWLTWTDHFKKELFDKSISVLSMHYSLYKFHELSSFPNWTRTLGDRARTRSCWMPPKGRTLVKSMKESENKAALTHAVSYVRWSRTQHLRIS